MDSLCCRQLRLTLTDRFLQFQAILPMVQDHKRVGDGDKGPNTGGMGSYSPLPQLKKEDRQRMIHEIVKPTMNGLVQGDYHYCGVLYIGLMMTEGWSKGH